MRWRYGVVAVLTIGILVVIGFWVSFLANYPLTRDVYFTVAILHKAWRRIWKMPDLR